MDKALFISKLSQRLNIPSSEAEKMMDTLTNIMTDELDKGNSIELEQFGSYRVNKTLERVCVLPDNQRMLVPPKLSVHFEASQELIDRCNKSDIDK